jgi:uncharacterized protein (TIGR03437 family)
VFPANLVPGNYTWNLTPVPIGAINPSRSTSAPFFTVNLTVTAPSNWFTLSTNTLNFSYTLPSPDSPAQVVKVVNFGNATNFTARVTYVSPRDTPWFTVSPLQSTFGVFTVTLSTNVLAQLGRGTFIGYFDVFASNSPGISPASAVARDTTPSIPNSPQRVTVKADVSPSPDFTVTPDNLQFSFSPGAALQQPQLVKVAPVQAPLDNVANLHFDVTVTNQDPQDVTWLNASPTPTGVPVTLAASLLSAVQCLAPGAAHEALITFNAPKTTVDVQDINTAGSVAVSVQIPPGTANPSCQAIIVNPGGIVNNASFIPQVAPGSLFTIFGNNMSSGTQNGFPIPLPTSFNGTTVTVNGVAAPLLFVSPTLINAQIPVNTSPGTGNVTVSFNGNTANGTVQVVAASPGFFVQTIGGLNFALGQHSDGSFVTPAKPARPGETIGFFGTGIGPINPPIASGQGAGAAPNLSMSSSPFSATINGVNAPVSFLGLTPGLVALMQVNIQVPPGTPNGNLPLILTINGVQSQAGISIPVGGP